jgi:beta-phosphoglucomutase-like phosphatase (HAD superfamily)
MPGFRNFLSSSILLLPILLVGCSSSKQTTHVESGESVSDDFLARYERTFDPTEYDPDPSEIEALIHRHNDETDAEDPAEAVEPELAPGFRVQVLSTQEIQRANDMRDEVSQRLPDEWAYVVYDSPYYKVRVGNSRDRIGAGQLLRRLNSLGYRDAWVVPDNVIKHPPPRPLPGAAHEQGIIDEDHKQ